MNEKHLTKTKFIENIKYLIQNKKNQKKFQIIYLLTIF